MSETLLRIPNEPDGVLEVLADEGAIRFRLNWPFDRNEDEWIALADTFSQASFAAAVRSARSPSGRGEVESETSSLAIARREHDFSFDFTQKGGLSKRAILDFPIEHLSELSLAIDGLEEVN